MSAHTIGIGVQVKRGGQEKGTFILLSEHLNVLVGTNPEKTLALQHCVNRIPSMFFFFFFFFEERASFTFSTEIVSLTGGNWQK